MGQGLSPHEAALKVGYAPGTAKTSSGIIVARPRVKAAIARVREASALACEVTREWVVARYAEIVREAKLPSDRLRALEGLLQMLGHDAPPAAANINHRHIFSTMSDADLVAERARLEPHVIDVTPAEALGATTAPVNGHRGPDLPAGA